MSKPKSSDGDGAGAGSGCGCPVSPAPQGVLLQILSHHVVLDNGILQVTLSKPGGIVTGIEYNGIKNLLEVRNGEDNRGYWDLVWNDTSSGGPGIFDMIKGTSFQVIMESEDQVEVSFTRQWDPSLKGKLVPLNIDKRFIMLRGSSGFYTYAIYEKMRDWPGFSIGETRIAFKLNKEWFQYMAVSDNRQRDMPLPDDRMPGRCEALAFAEAVLLTNPTNPDLKGEVDDKYQYSSDNKDILVHGWICTQQPTGFWQITPSYEYRSGGPVKQNLTSHVGPTSLSVFLCGHYAGDPLVPKFEDGESWKKVFGPVFIYCNSCPKDADWHGLWDDAKQQLMTESRIWPYNFPVSEDFPSSVQRGSVIGRLLVLDRYVSGDNIPASGAYVGLALPGDPGSWQTENKGYQFWTKADDNGCFSIYGVRQGEYNLFAWVPGFIGDYKYEAGITVNPGCDIQMGDLVYEPPRDGPTLWEIGFPDRTASEFYVPDPNPKYINKVLLNHPEERFRQYGLWDRYTELYPNEDLVYTIGVSDYRTDWFFAQVLRSKDSGLVGTTWQIKFKLNEVDRHGVYRLRLALASATLAEIQVRVNDPTANRPVFTTMLIGRDNSIARHGIHGLHWLYSVDIQGLRLVQGDNTIFLTQPRCQSPFQGIMYDYLRLEGPPSSSKQ